MQGDAEVGGDGLMGSGNNFSAFKMWTLSFILVITQLGFN